LLDHTVSLYCMRPKVLLLGAGGMVGSALVREIDKSKYELFTPDKKTCDLTKLENLQHYFDLVNPEIVINASGISGGILFNRENQGYLYLQNQRILLNLLEITDARNIRRLVNVTSSCIYPNDIPIPFKENLIGRGTIEVTNLGYASAKLSGFIGTELLGRKPNRKWINVIGSNLYGPGDSIEPERAHVISALIVKFLTAQKLGLDAIELIGNGSAIRDWLFVDDFARGVWSIVNSDLTGAINVSSNKGISVREIVGTIQGAIAFRGKISWQNNDANGAPIRILDNRSVTSLGWTPKIDIKEGIEIAIKDIRSRM